MTPKINPQINCRMNDGIKEFKQYMHPPIKKAKTRLGVMSFIC